MPEADAILSRVVTELFSPMYQLAVGVTIVYFLYGVTRYIIDLNSSNAQNQENGRSHLLYGMIGLFIILSVGGILKVMDEVLGGFFK